MLLVLCPVSVIATRSGTRAGGAPTERGRHAGSSQWRRFVDTLFATDWVVYAKPAFGGATAVLRYLGRYTMVVGLLPEVEECIMLAGAAINASAKATMTTFIVLFHLSALESRPGPRP